MKEIHDGVADIIASLKPDVLAIEQLYSHYDRPTTAILMGHARGVIVLAAAQPVSRSTNYAANRKSRRRSPATATPPNGRCRSVRRELNLPALPEPPDVADALAIALCHGYLSHILPPQSVG